jgi:hypothetical protein
MLSTSRTSSFLRHPSFVLRHFIHPRTPRLNSKLRAGITRELKPT